MTSLTAPDRRVALKARHREDILDAARELIGERGGAFFDFADLSERADLARRTVFNHFASMDDLLLALCRQALDVLAEDFVASVASNPVRVGDNFSMFDDLVRSLRSVDMPSAIATIYQILGHTDAVNSRARALGAQVFNEVTGRLVDEVQLQNPRHDRLDAQLLVGSLMNGVTVVAEHWVYATGGQLDKTSRLQWQVLLTRVIGAVRSGYMPSS